jgi:diguanylate cyclase (GGDEF)-like protein/PAS domain S-box-containing protein
MTPKMTKTSTDDALEYAESIINTVREPLIILDQDLRVVTASRSFYEVFKVNPQETVGQLIYDLGNKQWDIPKLRELLETILPQKATFDNYEVEHDFSTIGKRIMLLNARQIQRMLGKERIILLAIEDITERKRQDELLQAKEENFKNIFDNAGDGILLADLGSKKFYMGNRAICQMLGYSPEEIKDLWIMDIHPEKDLPYVIGQFERQAKGEFSLARDLPIKKKDGTVFYADVNATNVMIAGKNYLMGFFHDNTERKRAEEQLKKKSHDLNERVKELNCLFAISNILEESNASSDDLIRKIIGVIPPALMFPEISAVKITLYDRVYESDNYHKTDWTLSQHILVYGEQIGAIEFVYLEERPDYDEGPFLKEERKLIITIAQRIGHFFEREQAEEALRESEERYRNLFESSRDALMTLEPPSWRFTSGNPAMVQMFMARDEAEFTSKEPWVLSPDRQPDGRDSGEKGKEMIETAMRNGTHFFEWTHKRLNGEDFPATVLLSKVEHAGKVFLQATVRDITDRKEIENGLEKANEKLTILVRKFEKQNYLNSILTEMRDLLQACSTIDETIPIIMVSMTKLFPKAEGALFLMSPSRTDLESVARWGGFPEDIDDNIFAPIACWGLRRGRAHMAEDINIGPKCTHLKNTLATAYVCLPLMAKGDVLGLLHLRIPSSIPDQDKQQLIGDLKDLAVNLSEYLSLAVANIKLSESLSTQSIRDSLSGLFNRHFMEESLQREIQRAARKHSQIGIIMADLDYFKKFNDTYGHAAGDMCITLVGTLLKQRTRVSDIACRYGGEEFVLIFPDSSAEDTYKRADILRQEIKKMSLKFQGQFIGAITISMGVAAYPAHGINLDDLLRAADTALYKAKQEGRDRVVIRE